MLIAQGDAAKSDKLPCPVLTLTMAQKFGRQVVVIVPIAEGKMLMQLRHLKRSIDAPGWWGFFGESIAPGELPEAAARRELLEEVKFAAASLRRLGSEQIHDRDEAQAEAVP